MRKWKRIPRKMNFFHQPKPRRFEHINIYADDRKERIRKLEAQADRQSGNTGFDTEAVRKRLHESFTGDMRHLRKRERRRTAGGVSTNAGIIAIIFLVILIVWRVILRL